jgi:hypothetical protein
MTVSLCVQDKSYGFGVGVFGCGSGPFCVVLLFPAGETHFCLVFVWFLICLEFIEPRCS